MAEDSNPAQLESEFQNWEKSVKNEPKEDGQMENNGTGHQKLAAKHGEIESVKVEQERSESGGDGDDDTESKPETFVIRVRGLPWSTKEKDVREFFSGKILVLFYQGTGSLFFE